MNIETTITILKITIGISLITILCSGVYLSFNTNEHERYIDKLRSENIDLYLKVLNK